MTETKLCNNKFNLKIQKHIVENHTWLFHLLATKIAFVCMHLTRCNMVVCEYYSITRMVVLQK